MRQASKNNLSGGLWKNKYKYNIWLLNVHRVET